MLKKMTFQEFKEYIYDKVMCASEKCQSGQHSQNNRETMESLKETLRGFLNPLIDVTVIPFDEVESCGFVFSDADDMDRHTERISTVIEHKICDTPKVIKYDSVEEFRASYELSVARNYFMKEYLNPRQIRTGFVAYTGEGVIIHSVSLSTLDFAAIRKKRKEAEKESIK